MKLMTPPMRLLALFLLASTRVAAAQCGASPQSVIPFRWTPGQIEVQVSVNGGAEQWFIVDTGAEYSILDQQLAESLKLSTFHRGQRDFARGVALRLKDIDLRDQEVMVMPLDNFRRQGRPIIGLIGYDLFARHVVVFDYAAHNLTICDPASFRAPQGATTLPLTFADRLAVVPVAFTVDNESLQAHAILDTGASQSLILRYPFASSHGLIECARQYQAKVAGSLETATVTFLQLPVKSISFAGATFPAALRIYSQPSAAGGDTRTDGALGNEVLSRFRVTVDYSRRQIHLEPAEHAN